MVRLFTRIDKQGILIEMVSSLPLEKVLLMKMFILVKLTVHSEKRRRSR